MSEFPALTGRTRRECLKLRELALDRRDASINACLASIQSTNRTLAERGEALDEREAQILVRERIVAERERTAWEREEVLSGWEDRQRMFDAREKRLFWGSSSGESCLSAYRVEAAC
jgi:uncharacterized protein (DUF3084 family)